MSRETSQPGTDHLARVFGIGGCGLSFYLLYAIGELPDVLALAGMTGLAAAMAYHLARAASTLKEGSKNVA